MTRRTLKETMTAASVHASPVVKSPHLQWTAIAASIAAGIIQAWSSYSTSATIEDKAKSSETSLADAVEINSMAIEAGVEGLKALQRDRELLESEFRESVVALQDIAREHERRLALLAVEIEVARRMREEAAHRSASGHRPGSGRTAAEVEAGDDQDSDGVEDGDAVVAAPPSPMVEALHPPADIGKASAAAVERVQKFAKPIEVNRAWGKESKK
jgi:hypothetical protein